MNSAHFLHSAPVFHGIHLPEPGLVVGYAAIINGLNLPVPMPEQLALISNQNKKYQTDEWNVFPKKYLPVDNAKLMEIEALYNHLVFALKYEGVNLLVFSFLTKHYSVDKLTELVNIAPTGQYSRRIWFIVEWITGNQLQQKESLSTSKKSYVPLLDDKLQYSVEGIKSPRHLIINNLPGIPAFCSLIFKTKKLENYIASNFAEQKDKHLKDVHKDILQRASAFLLLKDSKASFTIEGESPKSKRTARWGQAIGQAGSKDLSKEEFLRLQQIVIENDRFVKMGFRKEGGFVGEHDRITGEPLPSHISAKWQDLDLLIDGLLKTNQLLLNSSFDAVLAASIIAFGFVFIHPFEDGNGRIHRYLIHHLLAKKHFSHQGVIFPISASILDHIDDYRKVLESYSQPLLDFIEWKETKDYNIEVLNDTIDYYKYFDATKLTEFLYSCVNDTIQNIIPAEVAYLTRYDQFKTLLEDDLEMPDKMIALLVRFLEQNNGSLSKRAKEREFVNLTEDEIKIIEETFSRIFQ
jgi:Fic family protein